MGLFDRDYMGDGSFNPDDYIVTDATQVADWYGNMHQGIDTDITLTKGRYVFTVGKPVKFTEVFGGQKGVVDVYDHDAGGTVQKRFKVTSLVYDVQNDTLAIGVNIIDNPIPIAVIWGAVAVICLITGAVTVNSVLENVERIGNLVFESPMGWILMVTIAAGVILPFFLAKK
jgi:hypothetical protein